jgi:hypothetical protein
MRKMMMLIAGLTLMSPQMVGWADMKDMDKSMDSEYCAKHCRTMDLRNEVQCYRRSVVPQI